MPMERIAMRQIKELLRLSLSLVPVNTTFHPPGSGSLELLLRAPLAGASLEEQWSLPIFANAQL